MQPLDLMSKTIQSVLTISAAEIKLFFEEFEVRSLETDDYFLKEGQVCNKIGFLTKGMVRHFYVDAKEETTRWVSLEGDFFISLASFITNQPSSHHLQAIAPSEVWELPKERWLKLYQDHAWVKELWARILEINCVGFENRVYQQLARSAEQRYEYIISRFPNFIQKVPQKYIASMMGVKPESLSRLRAQMARKRKS